MGTLRPSLNATMMRMAYALAARATCAKNSVGCILVGRRGRIIGSGYNGVPTGMTHCTDVPCKGATMPAGSDTCEAVHAEQNALLICTNPDDIQTCYVTHGPCLRCTKLLLNTPCNTIVYPIGTEFQGMELWLRAGRFVQYVSGEIT